MALIARSRRSRREEDRLAAIRAAIDEAHRLGITSVQDAGGRPPISSSSIGCASATS